MISFAFAATLLASTLSIASAKPTRRDVSTGKAQIVSYWGQGPDQKSLAEFCKDDTIDIIPIGFVNKFPGQEGTEGLPGTNFGNACWASEYYELNGVQTQIFSPCSNIVRDMDFCQKQGKKIMISIGGDSPGNQLTSSAAASSFADQLWSIFGPKPDAFTGPRPFGDLVVDGFDLDIESGDGSFVPDFAGFLAAKVRTYASKHLMLTAAPQCPFDASGAPDFRLAPALRTASFDSVFIQFYNNPSCAASSSGFNGNWDAWAQWLLANSLNKNIKMYMGIPGSPSAAPSFPDHYIDPSVARTRIEDLYCSSTYKNMFGGVMIWDSTYSENNQIGGKSYAANIRDVVKGCSCHPKPTTTTTTTTTTSTTTPYVPSSTSTTTTPYTHPTSSSTSTTPAVTTSSTSTTTPYTHATSSSTSTTPAVSTSTTTTSPYTSSTSSTSTTTYVHTPSSSVSPSTSSSTTSYVPSSSSTLPEVSSSTHYWSDWTLSTTTTSDPVDPTTLSTTTTTWEDWTTSSSSKSVDPTSTSSTTTTHPWEDWTTTSSKPVDPTSTSTTTTHSWEEWTTTSSPVDPASTSTTSAEYTWSDWVSTTTSESVDPTATSTHVWSDWEYSTTPVVSFSTAFTWAVPSSAALPTTVITEGAGSDLVTPSSGASKPVSPDAATTDLASESLPVSPATFTGGAPAEELPGTVLSVAVCVVVAVVGLFI